MATFPVGPNTGPMQAAYLASLQDAYSQPGIEYYGSAFGGQPMTYGGSGGGSGGGQTALDAWQQAYNQALQANNQRYQDILTGYQDRSNQYQQNAAGLQNDLLNGYDARYQRNMASLNGLGQQEATDIQRRYGELGAANQQDITSRVLTGTTIMPSMRQGIAREQEAALLRLNERLQNQRIGLDSQLSGDALSAQERMGQSILNGTAGMQGDTLSFAERRNDPYPDYNMLAQLAQGYGAAGGAYGGNYSPVDYVSPQQLGYQVPQFNQFGFVQPVAPQRPQNINLQMPGGGGGQPFEWRGNPSSINAGGGGAGGGFAGSNIGTGAITGGVEGIVGGQPFQSGNRSPTAQYGLWGDQMEQIYQQVVAILGREPQTVEEAWLALEQLNPSGL